MWDFVLFFEFYALLVFVFLLTLVSEKSYSKKEKAENLVRII